MKKNTLVAGIILIVLIAGIVYIYRNRAKFQPKADENVPSQSQTQELQGDIFSPEDNTLETNQSIL